MDGGLLREEGWLTQGEGSAFVSRPNELVCVRVSDEALASLPIKVQQLVDRGFHALVVELDVEGVPLDEPGENRVFAPLLQAIKHVEQFVGWIAVSASREDTRRALVNLATAANEREALALYPDVASAVEAYRAEAGEGEARPDARASDWGWIPDEATPAVGLDVAEVVLEPAELGEFPEQARELVQRGRVYLTVRIHRPRGWEPTSAHVTALVQGRDLVEAAGGQVALVAPAEDLQAWLRLLGEGQGFALVDSADEAERLHAAHSARGSKAPSLAEESPPFTVVTESEHEVRLRAQDRGQPNEVVLLGHTELPARIVLLGRAGVPALPGRLLQLASEDVQDVLVDLARFSDVEGERLEPLRKAIRRADQASMRVVFANASPEVGAMLELLGVDRRRVHPSLEAAIQALAAWVYGVAPFEELTLSLSREALTEALAVPAVPDTPSEVGLLAPNAEEALELREELARARARLDALSAERDAAQARASEAERARSALEAQVRTLRESAKADERRLLEHEQARRRAERQLEEQAASGPSGEAEALRAELEQLREQRALEVADLEDQLRESQAAAADLARVREELAELRAQSGAAGGDESSQLRAELEQANQEIEQVSHERELLREELESAGEMIERLGKELERS
ncbi:MAG: hypothetical protein KDD82_12620 [Planctomycetes bacterium]|nr:hypothetical protein [Planctomycetota bacterium]